MKQILAAVICAWLSVMLELAFADVLPRGALLLPVLCAVLTWRASVRLLLTGGILLLTDWIARPTLLPLVPLLLPALPVPGPPPVMPEHASISIAQATDIIHLVIDHSR